MSLNGSLSDMSVLETLQVIGQQRKTGTLEIQSGRQRRELHFADGQLLHFYPSRSADPDPMVEALLGLGLCDGNGARGILASPPGSDRRRSLEQISSFDPERFALLEQRVLQATLDRVLLWDRGHFRFTPRPAPLAGCGEDARSNAVRGDIARGETARGETARVDTVRGEVGRSIEPLLLETMRRLDEASDLKAGALPPSAFLMSTGSEARPAVDRDEETELDAIIERAILRRSDGRHNASHIAQAIGLAEWDVLTAALSLRDRGMLRLEKGARVQESDSAVGPRARLRHPLAPAAILLVFLCAAAVGWGIHLLTGATWGPQRRALASRAAFEEERAFRLAIEVYRLREGKDPSDPNALVSAGIWPAGQSERLAGRSVPSRGRDTIQRAASARSSKAASQGDGALPPDATQPASSSRP